MRVRSWSVTYWLLFVAAVAPALLAFRVQKKHWINIPIWDEWDTPGIALLHYVQRALTWGDLFAQHNESRKVVPRLIHIAIASVAGWDVRQGMVLTFLCACAASACALAYLRRRNSASPSRILFTWFWINLLLFAPSQYENFLSGFVFEIFIPFLCLFGCCAINLARWPLPAKVATNSFLALLSTYTFAHGMLLWAFAIPIPVRNERAQRSRFFVLWYAAYVVIGAISIAYYFVGYKRPEIAPPPPTLAQIPQILEFIFVWLGAVVRSPCVNARLSGVLISLVIAGAVTGTFIVLREKRERWPTYYPWLLLLGFALSSGALTAIGRVNIGVDNVFNTWFNGFSGMRYNTTSVFAYVAVIGLAFNLYEDLIRFDAVLRSRTLIGVAVSCTLLSVAWLQMFSDESSRVNEFQANRKRARTAVIWSDLIPENPEIFVAYPYPRGFAQRVEEMRAAGLLKLPKASDSLRHKIANVPSAGDPRGGYLDIGELRPGGNFRFAGWGHNPLKNTVAQYVVLGWAEPDNSFHPFTAISTGIVRPDVAKIFGRLSLKAGFDQEIDISKLPPHAVTITAWAIDWDTQQAFPIQNSVRLDSRAQN
jgi:hypothetical protein